MRPIHLLLGLVVVLASGASAYVATRLASTTEQPRLELTPVASSTTIDEGQALRARAANDEVAMLAAKVEALSNEIEALRSSASRAAVASVVQALEVPVAAAGEVSDVQRSTVLAVLAEDRARQAAESAAKRALAEQEASERRAARIAKELNLSAGDETRLAQLMFEGGQKRQTLMDSMRDGTFERDTVRTQFESLRTWQTEQYTVAFGSTIAEQLSQLDGGDRFGFGGGRGVGGGGDNPGGENGGRANRRNAAPAGGGNQ